MEILISVFPVFLFLLFLFIMDSFKLVSGKLLFLSLIWGTLCAVVAYYLNSKMVDYFSYEMSVHSKYVAPVIEELLKTAFVIYLVSVKRIGFTVDAAIYGFAAGAGFSIIENIWYLHSIGDVTLLVWILRGFGTAVMHGGCTAVFAIILIGGRIRDRKPLPVFIVALAVAILIHSGYNHFYIDPVIQTLGIITLFPLFFVFVFRHNINQMGDWLESEFSSEIDLLKMINKGEFTSTKAGEYLLSIKEQFSKEVIFDMYCYLRIYLELSIKAKSNIMLKESGIDIPADPQVKDKLAELRILRRSIGKVGELVLSPLIKMNYRNLWKINQNFI